MYERRDELIWKDREIRSPGDLVAALDNIDGPDEARAFMLIARLAWGDIADENVAYHTGYLPRDVGRQRLEWFGLEHPIIGDLEDLTDAELLTLGMLVGRYELEGIDRQVAAKRARSDILFLRVTHEQ